MDATTLRKYVANIEKELGFSLFERVDNRLVLSVQGKIFYEGMVNLSKQYQDLLDQCHQTKRLRLGIFVQEYIALPILKAFEERYPSLQVDYVFQSHGPSLRDVDALFVPSAIQGNDFSVFALDERFDEYVDIVFASVSDNLNALLEMRKEVLLEGE